MKSSSPIGDIYKSKEPCPCPYRVIDFIGGYFTMGAVGGSAFHFLKGSYNTLSLVGGVQAVRMNALGVGGRLAVLGGVLSTLECTMQYLRQKDDRWNFTISGAATGGLLWMHKGLGPASRSAILGGLLIGYLEWDEIKMNKINAPLPSSRGPPPTGYPWPNLNNTSEIPFMEWNEIKPNKINNTGYPWAWAACLKNGSSFRP